MLSRYWKAALAFLSLVSVTIVSILGNPEIADVLPAQASAYLSVAGVVVGTWIVWLKRNTQNVADLERIAAENGFKVVELHRPSPGTTELP
jgi:hypothetical protein